ncbi:hypothetical protein KCP75_08775 [Salmonella enterica subsp. enterica]|nr:hypothetical protein KCP75_08775 [Salmonella enterica subsp. enterica]
MPALPYDASLLTTFTCFCLRCISVQAFICPCRTVNTPLQHLIAVTAPVCAGVFYQFKSDGGNAGLARDHDTCRHILHDGTSPRLSSWAMFYRHGNFVAFTTLHGFMLRAS